MKLQVGDKVLVTAGKDKGKKGQVVAVLPKEDKIVVEDVNMYTRHVKPQGERSGEKLRKARPMSTAKVAILNEKDQPDRVGYKMTKDGKKERVFKKTGSPVPAPTKKQEK
ncbi:MAG: 50S ribosomal protein L24 [Patescibacteria group bacterium]